MLANESTEAKIRKLCKDREYAMALFLVTFIGEGKDIQDNAELYGLNKTTLEEVLRVINSLGQNLKDQNIDFILKKVSTECIEICSQELEKITRERINNLQCKERETLEYASYILKTLKEPYFGAFLVESRDKDKLSSSLCATLQVDYDSSETIAKTLLAKTGTAFHYVLPDKKHYYHKYVVPSYATKIIDEYAIQIEQRLKNAVDEIRERNDVKFLSALLTALEEESSPIFEAIYGEKWYEYLQTLEFPDVCYYGCVNYSLKDLITNIVIELAKSRFDKIYKAIEKALKEKGFEKITVYGPTNKKFYYTIIAARSGQDKVTIRVMPLPYKLPRERAEREVIVIEGPIARPEVIAKGRNYVIVEMDKNFERAINVFDYVNEDWGKEIAEVFKSLNTSSLAPLVSTRVPSTSYMLPIGTPLNVASLTEKDVLVKIKPYKSQARDILEAVSAAVLQDLGFKVKVNEPIQTKAGDTIKVDVWGLKTISGGSLKVYLSCKNYDKEKKEVDKSIIYQEIGIVSQLVNTPVLKFIVASKFDEQAKKIAERSGFKPIEVGFKVDEDNARDAYKKIYEAMKNIFQQQ